MLNLIRRHADSWMIKSILWMIIFAFVGTIFYSWGMGGASRLKGGIVATVEGNNIHFIEYDRSFNNLVAFYRDQFQGQFSDDLIKRLDLKTAALDGLIQKKLLLIEAQKQNIRVSNQELSEKLTANPAFQKDNTFDKNMYSNFLKFKRISAKEFEEDQRELLVIEKLGNLIKDNIQISEKEVLDHFQKEETKIKLKYLSFSKDYFLSGTKPTEEELTTYFEANKQRFKIPEQIKLEYIKLSTESLNAEIKIREEDIADYYEAKKGDFFVPKSFKASHILIRTKQILPTGNSPEEDNEKAVSEEEARAKAKAEEILKKIKDGANFEKMAKQHSDDKASGINGGSLGQFSSGMMVTEFETALNELKIGEMGGPVKTTFGFHIVRLDDLKAERIKPISEVKQTIIKNLKEIKGRQRVRRTIKRIHRTAEKSGNLAQAAKEHKVEIQTTGYISRESHNIPEIGVVPEFFNMALTLTDNELSFPLNVPEASYLAKVIERKASYVPELDKVRAEVALEISQNKDKARTAKVLDDYEQKLASGKTFEDISEELKLPVDETPYFNMSDSIPGIGNIKTIKERAFGLKKGGSATGSSLGAHYLFQVVDRQAPGEPDADQKKKIYGQLKSLRANAVFEEWLKGLREKAEIMIDRTLIS